LEFFSLRDVVWISDPPFYLGARGRMSQQEERELLSTGPAVAASPALLLHRVHPDLSFITDPASEHSRWLRLIQDYGEKAASVCALANRARFIIVVMCSLCVGVAINLTQ
jgi:hypothetical protein